MEETLKSILSELQKVNTRMGNLEARQVNLEQGQKNLEVRQVNLEARQVNLEQGQKVIISDIGEIKEGQKRMQADLVDNLGNYTEKILEHVDNKTAALNKRIFDVETDIQRIVKQ